MRIKIYSIGKQKKDWLQEACSIYEKRLTSIIKIEWITAKNYDQLMVYLQQDSIVICLDERGKEMTSGQFSSFLFKQIEKGGAQLSFVIGAAEGLPLEFKENFINISFSKLTFPHQFLKLLLIEQIYRASEINKGSKYHK